MFGLVREPLSQKYAEEMIHEYGFIRKEQLIQLFTNSGFTLEKARSYLNAIRSYGEKAFFDRKTNAFYASNYVQPNPERMISIDKCMWVLIDFIGKVEHHFPIYSTFTPSDICLMLEERSYEIAYCQPGNEKYFNNQLRAARTELLYRADMPFFQSIVEKDDKAILDATRYIVVVDDIEATQDIQSSQIAYFVTLDENNACTFYPVENKQTA